MSDDEEYSESEFYYLNKLEFQDNSDLRETKLTTKELAR